MNKNLITHGAWLLVSAGAFAIGGKVLSSKSEPLATPSEKRSRLSAMPGKPEDAGVEPASAMSELDKIPDYQQALVTLSNGGSPTAFVEAFLNEGDALEANKMFADLLLNLTAENAREIFDALRESGRGNENFGRDMGLLLQAWGRVDGLKAVEAVADLGGDGRRRAFGSMSAMEGWASTDAAAAKEHVKNAEAGWEQGMMRQGLISGIARTDPAAATAYVLELEADREASGSTDQDRWRGYAVDRQMEVIAEAQLRRGSSEATNWAEDLPEGDLKSSAFDRVAESLAKNDPAAAATWVAEHASADYAQRAVREVAEEYGRTSPTEAIAWAEGLPEGSQRTAMSETVQQWTRADPVAASEYLETMDDSPTRDSAVRSFARQLDREDPSVAAEWAATISNEETRMDTLSEVGSSWMRTDAEGAQAWLPTSGLSEEAQKKIIEQPAERGWGRGR